MECPDSFDRLTWSRFLREATCARTALVVQTQEVSPITTAIVTAPLLSCPMLNEIRINITILGITVKRLVMNMMMSSTKPPMYPDSKPRVRPIKVAMTPATRPICSDTAVDLTSSVSTSLPKLSVPSGNTRTFATLLIFT